MSNNVMDIYRTLVTAFHTPNQRATYAQTFSLILGSPVLIDFRPLIAQNKMDNVQGIWIDNSAGTSSFTVQVLATGQNFTILAGYQGSTILPMTADMQIVVLGAGTVPVVYTNFPLNTHSWPSTNTESIPITYNGIFSFPITTGTCFIQLKGSATKTVRIIEFSLSSISTASENILLLPRLSTADMGGTQTVVQTVAYDSLNPVATAVCTQAPDGVSQGGRGYIAALSYATGPTTFPTNIVNYVPNPVGQLPTLRGTGEYFEIGGVGFANGQPINGFISWTEE